MKPGLALILVDDEEIALAALYRELRTALGQGLIIETAVGPDEADEVIAELTDEGFRLFLVISDWLMPGRKGDEFLAGVKARNPAVRCIIISGRADPENIERARNLVQLDATFPKPWDRDALLEAVMASLERFEGAEAAGARGPAEA